MGIVGVALQRGLLQQYAHGDLAQVLLTLGCLYILGDLALYFWGPKGQYIQTPRLLQGALEFGSITLSYYRALVIGVGAVVGLFLWWFQEKTRYGAIVRAGVHDEQMTEGMGINITVIKTLVFGLGALMAGLAGVLGANFVGASPGVDMNVLLMSIVVVVIGGIGSLRGVFIGALTIGIIQNFSVNLFPEFSLAIMYIPMIIILLVRPQGLFGK
jgi:branched-chain amino acid transport system permease protein